MSVELEMNGKYLLNPKYVLFRNDDFTDFAFGISKNNHRDYSFAHDDFKNNAIKFWYKNKTFFFETKENIYMFDLGDDTFKIPLNTPIKATITNINENDELIYKGNKKVIFTIKNY